MPLLEIITIDYAIIDIIIIEDIIHYLLIIIAIFIDDIVYLLLTLLADYADTLLHYARYYWYATAYARWRCQRWYFHWYLLRWQLMK